MSIQACSTKRQMYLCGTRRQRVNKIGATTIIGGTKLEGAPTQMNVSVSSSSMCVSLPVLAVGLVAGGLDGD